MGPENGRLLEAGAHDGRLASDILGWMKTSRSALFETVEYWILEPSKQRRQWQQSSLKAFAGKVRWFDSWEAIGQTGVRGVIFANELLDAMPVHRLGWDSTRKVWFEWGVAMEGDRFVWTRLSMPHDSVSGLRAARLTLPPELLAVLPDGFTTEVCPAAVEWWQQASTALKQGRLLTFDYGLTREQFLVPERAQGTLRAYHQHRISNDLLANMGEQDLTAQVDFTALQEVGEAAGLKTEGLRPQSDFLTRVALETRNAGADFGTWTPDQLREFQTLTHPEHLGRSFKVLVQTR